MKISCTGTNTVDIEVSVNHTHTPTSSCEEFTEEIFLTSSMTLNVSLNKEIKKGQRVKKSEAVLMRSLPEL